MNLTDHQKNFIRNNYLKLTEPQMASILGTTRFFIQKFKREENLANRKKKEEGVKEGFFNVDEYKIA
jgi:hypothetical protein